MSSVGQNIKRRRRQLGMSAEQLAELVGVSKATMYRYEKGDIANLKSSVLIPIAQALKTTPADLMGWDAPTPPADEAPRPPEQTLTNADVKAVARYILESRVDAPRTVEARIVSFGMDKLPHEDRERLLAMVRAMYPGLFDERKDNNNGT